MELEQAVAFVEVAKLLMQEDKICRVEPACFCAPVCICLLRSSPLVADEDGDGQSFFSSSSH